MSEEKKFSEFVESMRRLYQNRMVQDPYMEKLLSEKKVSLDEYLYIVNGEGGVICTLF